MAKIIIPLLLLAILFSGDLFLHKGEAATFDSPIHITNMMMYARAIADGDFPVTWADGFANYGLPTPLVSQQLTSYLGALLILMGAPPVLAYKVVLLIGVSLGSVALYYFLTFYSSRASAYAGSTLFTFSAYRLINAYTRGALPELFAASLIPLILIGIHKSHVILTTLGLTLLIAAHPFVFMISIFLLIPYALYCRISWKKMVIALGISLGLNAWYLFPLVLEMKYFVISRNITQLSAQFLTWKDYFAELWPYFYQNDIFVRGNVIQFGVLESIVLIIGVLLLFRIPIFGLTAGALVFMTLPISAPLYSHIPFLDGIQFPWRMLLALGFFPPLVLSLILDKLPARKVWAGLGIFLILMLRLPEAYGKNYTHYSQDHYAKTIKNLHFDSLNTIWIGNTATYTPQTVKGQIIEGEGTIVERREQNSRRYYQVEAKTPIRMIDYTFYFPGWEAKVDGKPTTIEFQDVNYRGVITYLVPPGTHTIEVIFQPTKVRKVGYLVTLMTAISAVLVYVLQSRRKTLC